MTSINYNKVFVTGATGLVGSHVVCELLKQGKKVGFSYRNIDNLNILTRKIKNEGLPANFESYNVDLNSYEELRDVLASYEAVVHTAASVDLSKKSKKLIESNLNLTKAVVWASVNADIKRFIHISSIATLGTANIETNMIDETCNLASLVGKSSYTKSKFYCENEVSRAFNQGLCGVILNPSVIIGSNEQNSSSSKILSTLAKQKKYYSSGVTGYIGVNDVAKAVCAVLDSEISAKRLIVSSENLSYLELMTKCADILGFKAPQTKVSDNLLKFISKFIEKSEKIGLNFRVSSFMLDCLTSKSYYDGSLITKVTNFKYTPIEKQLEASFSKK